MPVGIAALIYSTWRTRTRGRFLLLTLVLASFAAFAVSIGLRATIALSARYVNFALPVIAVAAGAAWAWLHERGKLGQLVALALVVLVAAQGAYQWFMLVMYKYH